MMSSAIRRVGGTAARYGAIAGGSTRRGVLAFIGSSSALAPRGGGSRWASTTVMSAAAQTSPSLSVHKRDSAGHPAYEVLEEDFVAEYGATTTLYKHLKSGAEVLSVQIDDDNKVRVREASDVERVCVGGAACNTEGCV